MAKQKNNSASTSFEFLDDTISKLIAREEKCRLQAEAKTQEAELLRKEIEKHEKVLKEQKALLGKLLKGGAILTEENVAKLIMDQSTKSMIQDTEDKK